MGSKIYVGGLPYSTTEQQLSDLFAVHGAVTSARIITTVNEARPQEPRSGGGGGRGMGGGRH